MLTIFEIAAVLASIVQVGSGHDHDHDQTPIQGPHNGLWYNRLPGDGGTQVPAQQHASIDRTYFLTITRQMRSILALPRSVVFPTINASRTRT